MQLNLIDITGLYTWHYGDQIWTLTKKPIIVVLKVFFYGVSSTTGICDAAMEIMIEHAEKFGLLDILYH